MRIKKINELNDNSDNLLDDIKKFGEVEVCEQKGDKFHIKITTGFSMNAVNTFNLMKVINDKIGKEFPKVNKMVTDTNLFDYILSK